MSKRYKNNDRVEYYILRDKQRYHRVGYIKSRYWSLCGVKYCICVADRSREVDIVKSKQVFGTVEAKKDKVKKISNG